MTSHAVFTVQAVALFFVVAHAAVRLGGKVRAVRRAPRGRVVEPAIFRRMVGAYFILVMLASAEGMVASRATHARIAWAGLGLIVFSAVIQWKAFRDLGSAYSPDIEVRPMQALVHRGLYGWVRHPLLSALILEVGGLCVCFGAWLTLVLVAIVFVPLVNHRRRAEEAVLLEHFGAAYRVYQERVGALIPRFRWPSNPALTKEIVS